MIGALLGCTAYDYGLRLTFLLFGVGCGLGGIIVGVVAVLLWKRFKGEALFPLRGNGAESVPLLANELGTKIAPGSIERSDPKDLPP